jgi:hypothetical protein
VTSRMRRLLSMGPGEASGRARQALGKWADRRMGWHCEWPTFHAGRLAGLPPLRLFPGPPSETIRALDEQSPGTRARLLASADACLAGRLDLLGYRGLSFGQPPDSSRSAAGGRPWCTGARSTHSTRTPLATAR